MVFHGLDFSFSFFLFLSVSFLRIPHYGGKSDKLCQTFNLIAITRAKEGCISYDLHQDNENPNLFLFFENWESRELLEKHLKTKHIQAYIKATEGAIEEFILNEMTHIG